MLQLIRICAAAVGVVIILAGQVVHNVTRQVRN